MKYHLIISIILLINMNLFAEHILTLKEKLLISEDNIPVSSFVTEQMSSAEIIHISKAREMRVI